MVLRAQYLHPVIPALSVAANDQQVVVPALLACAALNEGPQRLCLLACLLVRCCWITSSCLERRARISLMICCTRVTLSTGCRRYSFLDARGVGALDGLRVATASQQVRGEVSLHDCSRGPMMLLWRKATYTESCWGMRWHLPDAVPGRALSVVVTLLGWVDYGLELTQVL
jgi:hypothetical protein